MGKDITNAKKKEQQQFTDPVPGYNRLDFIDPTGFGGGFKGNENSSYKANQ